MNSSADRQTLVGALCLRSTALPRSCQDEAFGLPRRGSLCLRRAPRPVGLNFEGPEPHRTGMKPAPFGYADAHSVEEACAFLAEFGDDAKIIAGGQSLVPLLNLRLARPAYLVDINPVRELEGLKVGADVTIGALTRQAEVEHATEIGKQSPLVAEAISCVGHIGIRNRGTVVGSLAHADPAAELPAVSVALDGVLTARSSRGTREIPASELFVGPFTTTLEPDEILTQLRIPSAAPNTGYSWIEIAQRRGDFALVGLAVVVRLAEDGAIEDCRLVFSGVDAVPFSPPNVCANAAGNEAISKTFTEMAELVDRDFTPLEDNFADAPFRRRLMKTITLRGLEKATERARSGGANNS